MEGEENASLQRTANDCQVGPRASTRGFSVVTSSRVSPARYGWEGGGDWIWGVMWGSPYEVPEE